MSEGHLSFRPEAKAAVRESRLETLCAAALARGLAGLSTATKFGHTQFRRSFVRFRLLISQGIIC